LGAQHDRKRATPQTRVISASHDGRASSVTVQISGTFGFGPRHTAH
jgi:hypothetical protein